MLKEISSNNYLLSGRLDIDQPSSLADMLSINLETDTRIDFSELESADSLLLAAVLNLARKAESQGGSLQLVNFPDKLMELSATYGIEALIAHHCQ